MISKIFSKIFFANIFYLILIFLISLLNLTFFRILLSFTKNILPIGDWFLTYMVGFRFDLASAGILTLLTFFFIIIFFPIKQLRIGKSVSFIIVNFIFIFILLIDYIFYGWLGIRLDSRFFPYILEPKMLNAGVGDVVNGIPFFKSILLIIGFITLNYFLYIIFIKNYLLKIHFPLTLKLLPIKFLSFILLILLIFLSIRGPKSFPLRANDYIYHNKDQLNVLSRSSIFHLASEIFVYVKLNAGGSFSIINETESIKLKTLMNFDLNIKSKNPLEHQLKKCFKKSPFFKKVLPKNPNIIFLLLESVGRVHFQKMIFLNEFKSKTFFTDYFFANGTSTVDGLWSTLCSALPSMGRQQTAYLNNKFQCLPKILEQKGYKNYYMFGGNIEMDQMGLIAKKNSFHNLISSDAYPPEKRAFIGMVDDNTLLERVLEEARNAPKPFFIYTLTAQTHNPDLLPNGVKPPPGGYEGPGAYNFLDYSLRKFVEQFEKEKYFEDTILVITADHTFHSQIWDAIEDASLKASLWQHRIPFYIYAPKYIKPGTTEVLTDQSDIDPTLYDMMDLSMNFKGWGESIFCQKEEDQRVLLISRRNNYFQIIFGTKVVGVEMPGFHDLIELRYVKPNLFDNHMQRVLNPNNSENLELMNFLYFINRNIVSNNYYWED